MIRAWEASPGGRGDVLLMERLIGGLALVVGVASVAAILATAREGVDLEPVLRPAGRGGFTLVELLVVILIVSIIAAVTLPVVLPAIGHRQVGESARIIQGALVGARDASLRTNTPHGIRFLPDPTYNGLNPGSRTAINPFKILASNRFIPIEQPAGYSEGRVFIDTNGTFQSSSLFGGRFINYPPLASGLGMTDGGASTGRLYDQRRVLMVVQSYFRTIPGTSPPQYQQEAPTSWFWNIRAGDKIQVNNVGPYFTVVGPMGVDNPEKFVNVDPNVTTLRLVRPGGGGYYFPDYLLLVNGRDDDGDGYIDNGWDGVDNDQNGATDDLMEWSENEYWPVAYIVSNQEIGKPYDGVPYNIVRRPVPSPGARETVLPGNVVVDLTSALLPDAPSERSRLPVDSLSGNVDLMIDAGGRMIPTTRYSSPASFGLADSFHHIWVGERSDLAEVRPKNGTESNPLVGGYPFRLPMPLGRNLASTGTGTNSYDDLVRTDPNLPYLKGEMRILSLSTRTGNMITTDSPTFDVFNVNQPYHAPQVGEQGETP